MAQSCYQNKVASDSTNDYSVEYFDTYKVLTNLITNERYALVCNRNGTSADLTSGFHAVVDTPLTAVGVDTELDVLPFFELLGISDKVKSAKPSINVTSPCYNGISDGPNGTITIDAIFTSSTSGSTSTGPKYISVSTGNTNLTPLQQTSWIVYVAHFFDMEEYGQQVYDQIKQKYTCHKSNLANSGSKNIAWTTYDAAAKAWTLHNDPYTSTLIADAGMKLVSGGGNQSNVFQNLQDFQNALSTADFVIDDSATSNFKTDFAYSDWLNATGLSPGSKNTFIAEKNVYRTDNLINKNGFSDWPVRHSARADLAIADVIHMVYNTYEPTYNMTWLRGFALMRDPQFISNASYPSCTNTVARIDINSCSIGAFKPGAKVPTSPQTPESNEDASDGLSTGGKVGVAVGVVVGVVVVAVAGTFMYRKKKHRANPEGTFVRMNDM